MKQEMYCYRANGLTLESEIELPELMTWSGEPDVHIRFGPVPARLEGECYEGARYQAKPGEYLLDVPGVARYWVRNGREVTIAAAPAAPENDLRVFILSSVMGALAHQNQFLPLHASAVWVDGECVLFAGDSGCGKSTLAAAFHERGYPLIADDICAVSLDADGAPVIHPGYRNVKLWADALEHVGAALGERHKLRIGMQKFSVRVPGGLAAGPLKIRRIFVLNTELTETIELRRLQGRAKMSAVRKETYRYRLLRGFGNRDAHFRIAQGLARTVEMVEVQRPLVLVSLPQLVDRLRASLTGDSAQLA